MSFFRRKETPQVPPPAPEEPRYNPDPYGYGSNDRYAAPAPQRQPNKLTRDPPADYGRSNSYGSGPDRYAKPDRYAQPDRSAEPDRYAQPDRYQQPDRYAQADRNAQPVRNPQPDRYGTPERGMQPAPASTRSRPIGDPYARSNANVDADRQALFAGYNPESERRRNNFAEGDDAPNRGGQFTEQDLDQRRAQGVDEEEDVEAIRGAMRSTKQESLASTRNALRIAREAEETARNTLVRLGDQAEKLADAERHIDVAKWNSHRAEDKTSELKQLNKSIFNPAITFNKQGKRAAQEAKMLARHEEEKSERERMQAEVRDSQARVGRAAAGSGYGEADEGLDGPVRGGRGYKTEAQLVARKKERGRYQFEATASDDELEDELDDNLDAIGSAVANMKNLSLAMRDEVTDQNKRLDKFSKKTDDVDDLVVRNTNRLKKY